MASFHLCAPYISVLGSIPCIGKDCKRSKSPLRARKEGKIINQIVAITTHYNRLLLHRFLLRIEWKNIRTKKTGKNNVKKITFRYLCWELSSEHSEVNLRLQVLTFLLYLFQIGQLQQRHGRMRHVGYGQADCGRIRRFRSGRSACRRSGRRRTTRPRVPGEQLRRGTGQALRIQKDTRKDPEDGRLRLSGGGIRGRVQGAVSQFAFQVPLFRLRRYRRERLQAVTPLEGHLSRYPGRFFTYLQGERALLNLSAWKSLIIHSCFYFKYPIKLWTKITERRNVYKTTYVL